MLIPMKSCCFLGQGTYQLLWYERAPYRPLPWRSPKFVHGWWVPQCSWWLGEHKERIPWIHHLWSLPDVSHLHCLGSQTILRREVKKDTLVCTTMFCLVSSNTAVFDLRSFVRICRTPSCGQIGHKVNFESSRFLVTLCWRIRPQDHPLAATFTILLLPNTQTPIPSSTAWRTKFSTMALLPFSHRKAIIGRMWFLRTGSW